MVRSSGSSREWEGKSTHAVQPEQRTATPSAHNVTHDRTHITVVEQGMDRGCAVSGIHNIGGGEGREREPDDHSLYEHADWNRKLVTGNN